MALPINGGKCHEVLFKFVSFHLPYYFGDTLLLLVVHATRYGVFHDGIYYVLHELVPLHVLVSVDVDFLKHL